ncbi:glutamyl-Q tRNA(Asp) synthetase [uncultured Blautia sp.]|nr:glutamyl-Q tRNA(Asp) synthetase [uncultured Blautia sp.]
MAVTGRFAPSPSGRIHLGNILCCRGADVPGHPVAGTGLGRGTCHRRPQRPL